MKEDRQTFNVQASKLHEKALTPQAISVMINGLGDNDQHLDEIPDTPQTNLAKLKDIASSAASHVLKATMTEDLKRLCFRYGLQRTLWKQMYWIPVSVFLNRSMYNVKIHTQ